MKIHPDIRKTIVRGVLCNTVIFFYCQVLNWQTLGAIVALFYGGIEWYRLRRWSKAIKEQELLIEHHVHLAVEQELEHYTLGQGIEEYYAALEEAKVDQRSIASYCEKCKFFYGKNDIHCAVHPSGGNIGCKDWEQK